MFSVLQEIPQLEIHDKDIGFYFETGLASKFETHCGGLNEKCPLQAQIFEHQVLTGGAAVEEVQPRWGSVDNTDVL